MKRIAALTIAATLALLAPASADEHSIATGITNIVMYHVKCEQQPPVVLHAARIVLNSLPARLIADVTQETIATFQTMGTFTYCKAMRPIVEEAVEKIRRVG